MIDRTAPPPEFYRDAARHKVGDVQDGARLEARTIKTTIVLEPAQVAQIPVRDGMLVGAVIQMFIGEGPMITRKRGGND